MKTQPRLRGTWPLALIALLALLTLGGAAWARSVYLNGVQIDGLTDQTFKGATVRLDSTGNVHITARGYSVKSTGGEAPPVRTGEAAQDQYWLVANETNPGKVQWDVEVFINGKLATTVRWDRGQVVEDVSSFVIQGDNQVHFRARRNLDQPRKSYSPADKLQIVIGSGSKQGKAVVVRRAMVNFIRSAADVDPLDKDERFTAR